MRFERSTLAMPSFAVGRPIWQQAVPANRRMSRQALMDIADSYFEGITQGRGDVTPFDPLCTRFENGGQMTLRTGEGANPVMRMSCQEQFAAGMLVIVTSVSHRRYLVEGKIRQVEATVFSVPYRMHPGWSAD